MLKNSSYDTKLNLCIFGFIAACFFNLTVINNHFDFLPIIIGVVVFGGFFCGNLILKKIYPMGDKFIFILSSALSMIGIVMLYRLKVSEAKKQVVWMMVGIGVFIFIQFIIKRFKYLLKYKYFFMILTLMFMSMAMLFGTRIGGANNWIVIGGFTFQPSEMGKVFLVLYLASALNDYGNVKKYKFIKGSIASLIEPALIVMISLGFMVLQRELGSALIIFIIAVVMLYLGTEKGKYVLVSFILFTMGAGLSYKLFYHVRRRVLIWRDPWKYAYNESYQVIQGLISICSGGFFGTGLGLGNPNVIPEITTDYIFAAICEEMGILVGIAILIIYFIIFYRAMRIALMLNDKFSMLAISGLSVMIAAQTLVIIGGIMGVIPLTGITLPLISYGGSSMLTVYFSLGIIQKISEEGNL
ncbi:FtsW/RodA/SpoVE family cell cycle protein [Oceanirhabdus sp. W0125-5]|uniref:FtsW/RodA/SpoVE family cell cycle protein n=1 Tax=Oceanirhabdus sp. W0125-5 TaxID=2999116 RepID=UPI0022F2BFB0|nr:FtsW/RodA/SpoVE family cell cycle protein [Oceanirhabdus sp. W0125-5]WBW99289.1 FtsW/RodA/SpoVE family cell cycle protein [Oceanirhabdus sp. W0125-5]